MIGRYLPHHVAWCVTKFSTSTAFREACRAGYVIPGATVYRVQGPGHARRYFEALCDGKFWPTHELGTPGPQFARRMLQNSFHPGRTRYYVTSAIGFKQALDGDFDPGDYANVRQVGGGDRLIMGAINPINVLEPLVELHVNFVRDAWPDDHDADQHGLGLHQQGPGRGDRVQRARRLRRQHGLQAVHRPLRSRITKSTAREDAPDAAPWVTFGPVTGPDGVLDVGVGQRPSRDRDGEGARSGRSGSSSCASTTSPRPTRHTRPCGPPLRPTGPARSAASAAAARNLRPGDRPTRGRYRPLGLAQLGRWPLPCSGPGRGVQRGRTEPGRATRGARRGRGPAAVRIPRRPVSELRWWTTP